MVFDYVFSPLDTTTLEIIQQWNGGWEIHNQPLDLACLPRSRTAHCHIAQKASPSKCPKDHGRRADGPDLVLWHGRLPIGLPRAVKAFGDFCWEHGFILPPGRRLEPLSQAPGLDRSGSCSPGKRRATLAARGQKQNHGSTAYSRGTGPASSPSVCPQSLKGPGVTLPRPSSLSPPRARRRVSTVAHGRCCVHVRMCYSISVCKASRYMRAELAGPRRLHMPMGSCVTPSFLVARGSLFCFWGFWSSAHRLIGPVQPARSRGLEVHGLYVRGLLQRARVVCRETHGDV